MAPAAPTPSSSAATAAAWPHRAARWSGLRPSAVATSARARASAAPNPPSSAATAGALPMRAAAWSGVWPKPSLACMSAAQAGPRCTRSAFSVPAAQPRARMALCTAAPGARPPGWLSSKSARLPTTANQSRHPRLARDRRLSPSSSSSARMPISGPSGRSSGSIGARPAQHNATSSRIAAGPRLRHPPPWAGRQGPGPACMGWLHGLAAGSNNGRLALRD